jgi:hypothetical protein
MDQPTVTLSKRLEDVPSKHAPSLANARKKWLGGEKSQEPRTKFSNNRTLR